MAMEQCQPQATQSRLAAQANPVACPVTSPQNVLTQQPTQMTALPQNGQMHHSSSVAYPTHTANGPVMGPQQYQSMFFGATVHIGSLNFYGHNN